MADLTNKKYYKEPSEWQRICNRFTSILYVEKTYDEIAAELGMNKDHVRKTLYKMHEQGLVIKLKRGNKAAYIRTFKK